MPNFTKSPPDQRPMIVTATIDPTDLALFNDLRKRYFPPERNYLSAHLTLFHHIPADRRQEFMEAAREALSGQASFTVGVRAPVSIGHGVAYPVEANQLRTVRQPLRDRFADFLNKQDLNPWKRPHITVQNKVDKEVARQTLDEVRKLELPESIRITGLSYYRYDYGPWTSLGELAFKG